MFNRSYQLRAVRKAGGGHQVAADLALRLPWAGIFEPWRPLVLVAAAAQAAEPAKKPVQAKNAANRCKKRSRKLQLELFPSDGKLRGVQTALIFKDEAAAIFTVGEKSMPAEKFTPGLLPAEFPSPAQVEVPLTEDELADEFTRLFP